MILAMRKKRLAFAKLSFVMAILALLMIDKPSPNSVVPLLMGQVYSGMKIGTQIGYNMTPDKFFIGRTFLNFYNILFLLLIWYKLREARRQKLDLEYNFFSRVDSVMARMSHLTEQTE